MAGETLETHDRVTISLSAHHQHHGNDPTTCTGRYNRFLNVIEDPYKRNIKVSPVKTKLDVGWLEEPSYLFIENRVGLTRSTIPSPEEKAEDERQVVELYLDKDSNNPILIRPFGGFTFIELTNPRLCHLKSQTSQEIPVAITLFPR